MSKRQPDAENGGQGGTRRSGDERRGKDVEGEGGRADGARPPGAKARHHRRTVPDGADDAERAADEREKEALGGEQPSDARRREAYRAQQPDFSRPLLDAEPEEEYGQENRGRDEEETEVREVLAEIRRAARRGEALRPHRLDRKAERQRIQPRQELRRDRALHLGEPAGRCRAGTIRIDVRSPNRDCHSRRPSSNRMNAFGVVRYCFQ